MFTIIRFFIKLIGYLLVLGLFAAAGLLASAGYWMPLNEEPMNAEAIVVLGGSATRAAYAAELYALGYAPTVYVSRLALTREQQLLMDENVSFERSEQTYAKVLMARGVPQSAITFFGDNCASTVQEAVDLAALLGQGNAALLVVTSPSHQRRASMIFDSTFPDRDVRVLGTPYDPMPHTWWNDREATRQVFSEFGKTVFYLLGFRFDRVPSTTGEQLQDVI